MVKPPATLTVDYIVSRWPRLFHMAEAGSWASIQERGLRSTTALLDLFEITGPDRDALEAERRPESVMISHETHGTAWIRDNKPINETVLRRTLKGMDEPAFYRTLNGRVFLWLTEKRLLRLRNAPPYRKRKHDILVIDTEALMERYSTVVELSPMNSGAVHPAANYSRGQGTFTRIPDYPWTERLTRSPGEPIVEVTVPYAIPDIAALVVEVRPSEG
jgi:hypothetical protein